MAWSECSLSKHIYVQILANLTQKQVSLINTFNIFHVIKLLDQFMRFLQNDLVLKSIWSQLEGFS